jgi:hypothetical protein
MGLFSKIPGIDWDYTRLKDAIDALTGETIRRRAQHVIVFDPITGEPIAFTSNGPGGLTATDPAVGNISNRLAEIFPIGVSNFDTIELPALTTTKISLSTESLLCRSIQVQSIRPNGTDNTARIAIGDSAAQTFYLSPGDVWGDSAPMGQTLDLSQIYVRALTAGDCISLLVRF